MTNNRELALILKLQDQMSKDLKKALGGLEKETSRASSSIGKFLSTAGDQAQSLSRNLEIGMAAGAAAFAFIGKTALNTASQFEQAEIAFKTLLGSTEAASSALAKIQEDAKKTPYNLQDLVKANQLLISAGVSADDARQDILALGNAVAATGGGTDELNRLAINLQQIRAVGQASALDIKQFGFAGINIYSLLSKSTGKTVEEIKNLASEGKIGYKELTDSLRTAAGAGGMFEGALEAQSKSLQGIFSNIQDTISLTMKDILVETGAFGKIKDAADKFRVAIENSKPQVVAFFKAVGEGVKDFVNSDGFKAFIDSLQALGSWVISNKDSVIGFLKGFGTALLAVYAATKIMGAISLLTSPLGLIIIALTALFWAWQTNFGGIAEFIKSHKGIIVGALTAIAIVIGSIVIPALIAMAAAAIPAAVATVAALLPIILIAAAIGAAVALLWTVFVTHWDDIKALTSAFVSGMVSLFKWLWSGIVTVVGAVGSFIAEIFKSMVDKVLAILAPFIWVFQNILTPLFMLLAMGAAIAFDWMAEKIAAVLSWIKDNVLMPYIDFLVNIFSPLIEGVVKTVVAIWNVLKSSLSVVWEAIKGAVVTAWNAIKGAIVNPVAEAGNTVKDKVKEIKDAIVNIFSDLWKPISEKLSALWNSIWGKMGEWKKSIEEWAAGVRGAYRDAFDKDKKASPSIMDIVGDLGTTITHKLAGWEGEAKNFAENNRHNLSEGFLAPMNGGLATAGAEGGGGVAVTIQGGVYLDRNAGAVLADAISQHLRNKLRL